MKTSPSSTILASAASAAFALVASAASVAHAQPAPAATAPPAAARTFGVDALVALPTGRYADAVDVAIGGLARLEIPSGVLTITGRAGLVYNVVKGDNLTLLFFPVYAGVRYPLGPSGLYIAGELGLTIGYGSRDSQFGSVSDTDTELGGTVGLGMRTGSVNLTGGLFIPDLDDAVAIGGSVGFDL
ncbi:MAG: hypothetical protein R3B48_11265 [Kofleriaceae bacterium]